MGIYVRGTLRERFDAKVERRGECWIWIGAVCGSGYGSIGVRRRDGTYRIEQAHRVSWLLHHGKIPRGLFIRHHCEHLHEGFGSRRCVNPDHLSLGTARDNAIDMVQRGRRFAPDQRGEANAAARLSDAEVASIREIYDRERVSQSELAKRFGVQQPCISRILSGKRRAA